MAEQAGHTAAPRAAVQRAARLVDPDFVSAGVLWQTLLERMPPIVQDAPAPVASQAGFG
ncbi:MAG: hypothetical protein WKG32_16700 [Gemmatimonadaceae bacterium]